MILMWSDITIFMIWQYSVEGDHHVEIGINMDLLTKRDKNFLKRSAAEDTTSTENEEDDVIEPVIVKRDFLSENKNSNSWLLYSSAAIIFSIDKSGEIASETNDDAPQKKWSRFKLKHVHI